MTGDRLGNWVIDRELGRGGMGHVYLAHEDPPSVPEGRQAALKVLPPELAQDPGFRQRFEREIAALRQMDHPNIVKLYDSGEQGGKFYFAMEYVDGRDYAGLLAEQGRIPWRQVLDMAVQVCAALKHAHDRGVVHRDLKPPNILRAASGTVKLTDFGVARLFAEQQLTATGGIVGTAEYVSPEQAAGKPASKRSDFYSLGVVMYTLLTGRPPFKGHNIPELLHKHRYAKFDRPHKLVPELPYEVDEVVCCLLEKDPDQRPGDARVLQRLLERVRDRLDRKSSQTLPGIAAGHTVSENAPAEPVEDRAGPATIMSRLMRRELEWQKYGGPVQQWFNRPLVLGSLLALCIGILVWSFWPLSQDELFRRGAALMAQEDPDEWERGWQDYLQPLERKYPDHPYKQEVEEFRRRVEELPDQRQARQDARRARPMGEAQWFYQQGLRLRQRGDEAGARRVWHGLVHTFGEVPSQKPWVELAQKQLDANRDQAVSRSWGPVQESLKRARALREQGKRQEAEEIWAGLEELYGSDPGAAGILDEVRRDRGR